MAFKRHYFLTNMKLLHNIIIKYCLQRISVTYTHFFTKYKHAINCHFFNNAFFDPQKKLT